MASLSLGFGFTLCVGVSALMVAVIVAVIRSGG